MDRQIEEKNEIARQEHRAHPIPVFPGFVLEVDDMKRINAIAPNPLRADQVYIRSMYLCSSQPCLSDGCQLTRKALEQIAALIVGQSVLIGHNRQTLPIARFFKADVVQRGVGEEGEPVFLVRAWFYWLRDTSGARDLLLNIDGGIYKEVSLSWRYATWRCSVCGAHNGVCGHRAGEAVDGKICFRQIDQVTEVLEGSLVYKGADPRTLLTGTRQRKESLACAPLMLICGAGDPLLADLKNQGIVREEKSLSDAHEMLKESVEHLWLRSMQGDDWHEIAESVLAEEGVCLYEEIPAAPELPIPLRVFVHSKTGASMVLAREVQHDAIR